MRQLKQSRYKPKLLWTARGEFLWAQVSGKYVICAKEWGTTLVLNSRSGKVLLRSKAKVKVSGDYCMQSFPDRLEIHTLSSSDEPTKITTMAPRLGCVSEGRVYFVDGRGLVRASLQTGKVEESRLIPELALRGEIVANSGRLFFRGGGHEIFGLEQLNFKRGWRNYCDAEPTEVVSNGRVFGIGTLGYKLISLNAQSEVIAYPSNVGYGYQMRRSHPTTNDKFVCQFGQKVLNAAGETAPLLMCCDAQTGKLKWRWSTLGFHASIFGNKLATLMFHRDRSSRLVKTRWGPFEHASKFEISVVASSFGEGRFSRFQICSQRLITLTKASSS